MDDILLCDLQSLITIAKTRQTPNLRALKAEAANFGMTDARFDAAVDLWRSTLDATGGMEHHLAASVDTRKPSRDRLIAHPS